MCLLLIDLPINFAWMVPSCHSELSLNVTSSEICALTTSTPSLKQMSSPFFHTSLFIHLHTISVQFSSVTQLCLTLCDPTDCSRPGSPVHHQLLEFTQTHVHQVGDAIQPSHPLSCLLLLPSIFPSIRVFSNESVLHVRWSKYCTFSFSISPSNECSGLISFRIDWLDLRAVQGTLKSLLQHNSSIASIPQLYL